MSGSKISTLNQSEEFETAANYSASITSSDYEQKPSAAMASQSPKKSWCKSLVSCFYTPYENTFDTSRGTPLSLLPTRDSITITVSKVKITSTSGQCEALKKEVAMQARVRVTVKGACCCGPRGKTVRAKQTYSSRSWRSASTFAEYEDVADATVAATEAATAKAYNEALAWATNHAVAVVQRKYAKQASKTLCA